MTEPLLPKTVRDVRAQMDAGLTQFLAALDQLSDAQMLNIVDAAGWNVRDHLTHLAAWANGVAALIYREDRWAAMGIPTPNLDGNRITGAEIDQVNARIAALHQATSPADARAMLTAAHQRLSAAVETLRDDELTLPYARFAPPFTGDSGAAIIEYIVGDSYEHYAEHQTWILELVGRDG
jgi:hypothetical protein